MCGSSMRQRSYCHYDTRPRNIVDVFYAFLFFGLPVIWLVTLIWTGIVLGQKGHGLMVLWILVPFGFIIVIVLAAQTIAKPGSIWFRRYEVGGAKATEAMRRYPNDAARTRHGTSNA
jgi:hypothetical protein